jgi:hypothetical protein
MAQADEHATVPAEPADPRFADAVPRTTTGSARACGQALFRRLLDVGTSVTIDKPQPPTNPPNA